jgi:hypothetical protein
MGWNNTFTQAFVCKVVPGSKKIEIAKAELNVWNPLALFAIQNHHGPLLMVPKKD